MSVLKKINKILKLQEEVQLETVHNLDDLICFLKTIRKIVGNCFLKVEFDSTGNGTGVLFLKFSKCPWEKCNNQQLSNSELNFMITIDGFDDDGNVCEETCHEVCMYKLNDQTKKLKKLRTKEFFNMLDAGKYVKKYFEENASLFPLSEDGEGGSSPAPTGTDGGGFTTGMTSSNNIATFKKRLGSGKPIKRSIKLKGGAITDDVLIKKKATKKKK